LFSKLHCYSERVGQSRERSEGEKSVVFRIGSALHRFGLPTSLLGNEKSIKLSHVDISQAMKLDKKMTDKVIRWVLLQDIGSAVVRSNVPYQDVLEVLQELIEP